MALTADNRAAIEAARRLAAGARPVYWGMVEEVGPVSIPWRGGSGYRVKKLRQAVGDYLPRAWGGEITQLARAARQSADVWQRDAAEGNALAYWLNKYAGADGADLSENDIRDRAEKIAGQALELSFTPGPDGARAWDAWARLCDFVARHGGEIKPTKKIKTLEQWRKRAECARWWRRQLRKWVAQNFERGAIELGRVGAQAGEWYCSNRAVKRRIYQVQSNEAAMRAAVIESASGQRMSVWDAAQLTVSNKAIRRGELMTRIRGCEDWADARGLEGIFTTNTCPSRFHAWRKEGGANPKYQGATPGDAQAWLSATWARCRAKLARDKLKIMGFRVAEPHHDGCPHWHMLIWCQPGQAAAVEAVMRAHWLADSGDEPGAEKYRVNVKRMERGGAAGYIAKYISKNIDDVATRGHSDDYAPGLTVGPDLLGDLEVKPCQRVEAWAALWRIRQFQPIGQPPVTVWRELRRVTEQAASGGSDGFILAWLSVHRRKDKAADWHGYMRAQGGAMMRRDEYRFCAHKTEQDRAGRYETVREQWACGVLDRRGGGLPVAPTKRERWGGEGFAAARSAAPWTRLNNCTHNGKNLGRASGEAHQLRRAGLLDDDRGRVDWPAPW